MDSKDVILSAVVALATLILRDGGPLIKNWLNRTSADRKVRAELENKGYEAVICRMDKQILTLEDRANKLEAALDASRKREYDCEIRFVRLEEEFKNLKQEVKK